MANSNTVYWLSISNNSDGTPQVFNWAGDTPVNASLTFDNGATWIQNQGNFWFRVMGSKVADSGVGGASGTNIAVQSDIQTNRRFADAFAFASPSTVTKVEWTGIYGSSGMVPIADDFTIEIRENDGGSPGAILESFYVGNEVSRIGTGEDVDGFEVYSYSAAIDFNFQAGPLYWMTIYNDTTDTPSDNFFWAGEPGAGGGQLSEDGGLTWTALSEGVRADFRLFSIERPANDGINDGPELPAFPFAATGTNFNATTESPYEQQLLGVGSTVWWYFIAEQNGMVTIDTAGSNYDTQLHIYVDDIMPVTNNDDISPGILQSEVTFSAEAGKTYEVRVGGWRPASAVPGEPGDEGCIFLNGTFEADDTLLGDVNLDGVVNLLDVAPFVDLISAGGFQAEADCNEDGTLNLLDVNPFIAILSGG